MAKTPAPPTLMATRPRSIAVGRTAEILPWETGKVLKLYFDWMTPADIEYEAQITRAVHSSGVPAPAVGDIVELDGRLGLELERIDGQSLSDLVRSKPWRYARYARLLAHMHADMHSITDGDGIPLLHERLERKILNAHGLSAEVRKTVLAALKAMPQGSGLCHGDFHLDNVILTENGPVAIDWIDAAVGNPLADVARTSVLALGEMAIMGLSSIVEKTFIGRVHAIYRKEYFARNPDRLDEYEAWLPIVAAGRLSEGIEELAPWLIDQAEGIGKGHTPD